VLKIAGRLTQITPGSLTGCLWHTETKAAIDALGSSNEGLDTNNAAARLKVYGPNTLKSAYCLKIRRYQNGRIYCLWDRML